MTDPALTAKVPRWLKLTLWMVAGLCFALAMWLNFAKGTNHIGPVPTFALMWLPILAMMWIAQPRRKFMLLLALTLGIVVAITILVASYVCVGE